MNKNFKMGVAALGVAVTLASGAAFAATQNFTANVSFAAPLTLTKLADPNFGTLKAGAAANYSLSTAGVVTPDVGGEVISTAGAQAGQLKIQGSATQAINISAGNYVANNGVTPSNAACSYDGNASGSDCGFIDAAAPTAAGKTLLVGLTIAADGTQVDGQTAAPTFDVNVVYN